MWVTITEKHVKVLIHAEVLYTHLSYCACSSCSNDQEEWGYVTQAFPEAVFTHEQWSWREVNIAVQNVLEEGRNGASGRKWKRKSPSTQLSVETQRQWSTLPRIFQV